MKTISFCLLLITSTNNLFAQSAREIPPIPTVDSFDLKGNVTALTEQRFTFPGGIPVFQYKKEISFNALGMADTLVVSAAPEEVPVTNIYRYDEQNRIKELVTWKRTDMEDSMLFLHNNEGQLRKIRWYDGEDRLGKVTRFRYSGGRLLYIRKEDGQNRLQGMIRFRHYGSNEYKRMVFDNHLRLTFSEVFTEERDTLNSSRTVIRYNYTNTDSLSSMVSARYDRQGRLTALVRTAADKNVTDYLTNIYNEQGYLTEQTAFADSKVRAVYSYELDEAGNWLKRERHVDGELAETVMRKLSYGSSTP